MKIYKIEVMVLDFEELGEEGVKNTFENTRYSGFRIRPKVKSIESRDIGEWSDDHPMNLRDKADAEYQRLFAAN